MPFTPAEHTLVNSKGRLYLTADERQRVLETARTSPNTRVATFAATLAYPGCRISEALAARIEDIDLTNHTIRFRTLKRRAEHWREVPLPDAHLRELRARQRTRHATDRPWPIGGSTGSRHIAALMKAAGIAGPQASPKGLRHGYGSPRARPASPSPPSPTASATPTRTPPASTPGRPDARRENSSPGCGTEIDWSPQWRSARLPGRPSATTNPSLATRPGA